MPKGVHIGQLNDIPSLGARIIQTEQGKIAVFRTTDDQVFALADSCPHKGGPLSQGIVSGHTVTCPLHNWHINLETGEAVSPDVGCTKRFDIYVDDSGQLYLESA